MTLLVHDFLFEFLIVMSSLACILETYLRWRTIDVAQVRWVVVYHMSDWTEQHLFCFILLWVIFLSRIVVILLNQIRLYIKCSKRIIPEIARWMMTWEWLRDIGLLNPALHRFYIFRLLGGAGLLSRVCFTSIVLIGKEFARLSTSLV